MCSLTWENSHFGKYIVVIVLSTWIDGECCSIIHVGGNTIWEKPQIYQL